MTSHPFTSYDDCAFGFFFRLTLPASRKSRLDSISGGRCGPAASAYTPHHVIQLKLYSAVLRTCKFSCNIECNRTTRKVFIILSFQHADVISELRFSGTPTILRFSLFSSVFPGICWGLPWDILTLEDEDIILPRNVRIRVPTDAASYLIKTS